MKNGESHPFFSDVGYSRSGQWAISTSGLVGAHLNGWGFGEVMEGGIGIGYAVDTDNLRFTVSSGRGWSHLITANLEIALAEMEALFASEEQPPRSKL
jgi:carnitine O-acetyltransferase